MKVLRVVADKSEQCTVPTEIILIQSDTDGRCNIGMGLAKLKKLKDD